MPKLLPWNMDTENSKNVKIAPGDNRAQLMIVVSVQEIGMDRGVKYTVDARNVTLTDNLTQVFSFHEFLNAGINIIFYLSTKYGLETGRREKDKYEINKQHC